MSAQLMFQTLQQAVADKDAVSLFVLNVARPTGNLNFVVGDAMGGQVAVQIPLSSVPVDLTLQAERSAILKSPDFRKFHARGFCKIVTDVSATEYLQDPENKKEYNRVNKVIDNSMNAEGALTNLNPEVPILNVPQAEIANEEVDLFVQSTIAGESSSSEDEIISALRSRKHTLTRSDWEYITKNSSFADVKQYAAECLASIE